MPHFARFQSGMGDSEFEMLELLGGGKHDNAPGLFRLR